MKILYLSPIFEISDEPGSDRYFYNLNGLAQKGHQVRVITSSVIYKQACLRPELKGRIVTQKKIGKIEAIYLWSYPNIRGNFVRRLIYLISFMVLAVITGLFVELPDVIYTPNSPGMVGYAGYILARLRRVPLVFEVADVWPEAGIVMGTISSPILISLMRRMEYQCYNYANRITALTQGIKRYIEAKGYSPEKIILVTNGVDPDFFLMAKSENSGALRTKYSLEGKFVLGYLGAHGHYNSLWTIIETAKHLKDDERFAFVLIGDGDYKAILVRMVQEFGLKNTILLPPIPRIESPEYLAMADAFLLPNRRGDFFRMNLPNKLFDFLMSGRPIVVAGEGETADIVQAANAGMVVPAEDSLAMADALRKLIALPANTRQKMGESAQKYVIKFYDRKIKLGELEQVFASIRN
jgi:hypothetical protein